MYLENRDAEITLYLSGYMHTKKGGVCFATLPWKSAPPRSDAIAGTLAIPGTLGIPGTLAITGTLAILGHWLFLGPWVFLGHWLFLEGTSVWSTQRLAKAKQQATAPSRRPLLHSAVMGVNTSVRDPLSRPTQHNPPLGLGHSARKARKARKSRKCFRLGTMFT